MTNDTASFGTWARSFIKLSDRALANTDYGVKLVHEQPDLLIGWAVYVHDTRLPGVFSITEAKAVAFDYVTSEQP